MFSLEIKTFATNSGRLSKLHFLTLHHINSCMTACVLFNNTSAAPLRVVFQTCIFTVPGTTALTVFPKILLASCIYFA